MKAVDVAAGGARSGAETAGRRGEDLAEVQRRRELDAGLGHQPQPFGVLVEVAVQGSVGHRLSGDLPEAAQQVGLGEFTRSLGIQTGHADHGGGRDERELDQRPIPEAKILLTFVRREPLVGNDVWHRDRRAEPDHLGRGPEVLEAIDRAGELLVQDVAFDADKAAQHVSVDGVDVAGVGAARHAHPARHGLQDLLGDE